MKKLDVFYDIMQKNITIFLFCLFSLLLSAKEITLWATSDIHGVLLSKNGGMARILSILEAKRKDRDILVDAGDLFQGSYIANKTAGSLIVNAFNLMNYDFYVPGNHEFEFGSEILRKNLERMHCGILCANWRFTRPLAKMRPYSVIVRNSMRIAVIGAGERESRCRILPDKSLAFMDEDRSIALALRELRKEKVDLIVLVRHGGIYFRGGSLFSLLQKFPEIDLVIGGHSHQIVQGRKIAGAYYVQPGMLACGIAEVRVKFDERTRRIVRINSVYHNAADIPPSPRMSEICAEQRRLMKAARRSVRLELPSDISENVESVQKYLTVRAAAKAAPADAYLFFIERSGLNRIGKINDYLLHRMFPYENSLVTVPVSLKEFRTMLGECRRYSEKYKVKMLFNAPRNRQNFLLQTTSFVLSGGGRNFPESRRIAERKSGQIKVYPSMRRCAADLAAGK